MTRLTFLTRWIAVAFAIASAGPALGQMSCPYDDYQCIAQRDAEERLRKEREEEERRNKQQRDDVESWLRLQNQANEERAVRAREESDARDAQRKADIRALRARLQTEPALPADRNPLLGRWSSVARAPSGATSSSDPFTALLGLAMEMDDVGCTAMFGRGPVTAFTAGSWTYDLGARGTWVSPVEYRMLDEVIYVLPAKGGNGQEYELLGFEVMSSNRLREGVETKGCVLDRAAPAAAVESPKKVTPGVSPAPAGIVGSAHMPPAAPEAAGGFAPFTIFGVQLGAERYDAVYTMLDRAGTDLLSATLASSDATSKGTFRRLVANYPRLPGTDPRNTRIWFDFTNSTDPVLARITVLYIFDKTGVMDDRVAALTRQFGADDDKRPDARWHRVVPGAEIALYTAPETGTIIEEYVYPR
jgi:hypothetical protein